MPGFIRINDKVIAAWPDSLFWIIAIYLTNLFKIYSLDNKKLEVFYRFTIEYGEYASYSDGEKEKLDISTIFKEDSKDISLLITLLKEISDKIQKEIPDYELYALNGAIKKIDDYYNSLIQNT